MKHCICDEVDEFDPEFHMGCDGCDQWGHKESGGWFMPVENGPIYCSERCAEENRKAWENL